MYIFIGRFLRFARIHKICSKSFVSELLKSRNLKTLNHPKPKITPYSHCLSQCLWSIFSWWAQHGTATRGLQQGPTNWPAQPNTWNSSSALISRWGGRHCQMHQHFKIILPSCASKHVKWMASRAGALIVLIVLLSHNYDQDHNYHYCSCNNNPLLLKILNDY